VESVSNSTKKVTECNNTPTNGANVVVGGASNLRSTMDASSTNNILWKMPKFTVMNVLSGPVTTNSYQWFQVTENGYTGYVAWLDLFPSQPATTNAYQWNITQFKNSAASPWWKSVPPTYIYLRQLWNGNGHSYEAICVGKSVSWTTARDAAVAMGGHLATITSKAENGFVFSLISDDRFWKVSSDGTNLRSFGPWLGGYQYDKKAEPAGHWRWVTPESWSYQKWGTGEPDNDGDGNEDYLHYFVLNGPKAATWNDLANNEGHVIAYVVEFEPSTNQPPPTEYDWNDFSSTSNLTLNGKARATNTTDGAVIRLVSAQTNQRGSVFTSQAIPAATFSAFFRFRMTNPGGGPDSTGARGADGLVFVVQSASSNSIGSIGGGMGYGGIGESVGVEFDTYLNSEANDPSSNHLGIDTNGYVDHVSSAPYTKNVSTNFDNGHIWDAWVDYDGTNLEVRASRSGVRPAAADVSRPLNIVSILGQTIAYVGVTAATGNAYENVDILSLIYRDSYNPVVPDTLAPSLSITSHTNLESVPTTVVTLSGSATDVARGDDGVASVTVNGVPATNDTATGAGTANWSRALTLRAGTNTITVVASDGRGNSVTNTLRLISDTTKPTVTITTPMANQRWSNAVFTVKGTAKDNVQVSSVWCLTNGVWGLAANANGWTNWTVEVALVPGTNTVRAYAVDGVGNKSLTNSVNFIYVVSDRLLVQATGPGTLSPNYSNAVLEIGKNYSMTATLGKGFVLSNWVGTVLGSVVIVTNTAKLTFIMQSNLVLQANIIPNPFLRANGTYNGLFAEAGRAQESSGFVTLAVTEKGAYSGSLRRGTSTYPLTGQFDVAGWASKTVLRPRTNSWAVAMRLDLAGAEVLTGTLGDGHWLADLRADRAVFNAQTNPATQYASKYTLIIPGSTDASASPGGEGYGAVVVSGAGQVTLSGSLADGSALSQTVPVSRDGRWPLYASLYTGKGSVWSWLAFDTNQPAAGFQGELSWIKQAQPGVKYYPAGFTNEVVAVGSRYTQPAGQTNRVIHLTNGVVSFEGGNLSMPFTNLVSLTLGNKVINASSNSLSLSLTLSSGRFSGSATVPGTKQNVSFKGALLQNVDVGYGYFLGTNQSGSVYFGE
jgi:hypothetical protein